MTGLLVLWIVGCAVPKGRTPVIYEIPEGFRGWLELDFERPDCDALPKAADGHSLVVHYSSAGVACTTDSYEEGSAVDEYYAVGPSGRQKIVAMGASDVQRIWGENYVVQGKNKETKFLEFFVGTEREYEEANRTHDRYHPPREPTHTSSAPR